MTVTESTLHPVGIASRRLSLSGERVRQLCAAGVLKHLRDSSGRYLLSEKSLRDYERDRGRARGRARA